MRKRFLFALFPLATVSGSVFAQDRVYYQPVAQERPSLVGRLRQAFQRQGEVTQPGEAVQYRVIVPSTGAQSAVVGLGQPVAYETRVVEQNIPANQIILVQATSPAPAPAQAPAPAPAPAPTPINVAPMPMPAQQAQPGSMAAPAAWPMSSYPAPAGAMAPDGGCMPYGAPCAGDRFYGSIEYLRWRVNSYDVPPLVTTGPASFPVGFLDDPNTVVLFGGGELDDDDYRNGLRGNFGYWLNGCRSLAIDGSVFYLDDNPQETSFSSAAFPVLARPFTDAETGGQFSEFLAFPGIATGGISINSTSDLWGADINLRKPLSSGCDWWIDGLAGFRYLDLDENLRITETVQFSPTQQVFPQLAGRNFLVIDDFSTRNQFYGGQVGTRAGLCHGNWTIGVQSKLALGVNRQQVNIGGGQQVTERNGTTNVFPGGLLALPTNIGRHERSEFGIVPEIGITVGYQITCQLRVTAGYNLLWWNDVLRPGEQIDPVLDTNQIPNFPGPATPPAVNRPTVPFRESDLWVHGLSVGLEFKW